MLGATVVCSRIATSSTTASRADLAATTATRVRRSATVRLSLIGPPPGRCRACGSRRRACTAMLWYSSTSCAPTLSTWPMGMPRTKTEPVPPEVTTYWPTFTRSFLSTYSSVTSPVTLPLHDALRAARLDHGVDVALLVGDERDLRRVRVDLGDAAHEARAVDHRVVHLDPVAAAGVDGHRRVPGGGGTRHHARRDQRHVLRETRGRFWKSSMARSWSFSSCVVSSLGDAGAQLLDLLLERLVLATWR